ncbi:light harvesting complex photosystem II subunit 6 [Zea mays]|uniref:Chlorophyll a-b binding protein, chloroplastic n=1 Tax=Zea mays TaxID=4577 RepID=A0A1D6MM67_MAIZE|nr:light harvesting complex photosystem II subunit 6 [Zea mays]|eukprot:XP_020406323.1 chlorophyll a-b binding protein CP24 10B, chloroplastic [Zea mays]
MALASTSATAPAVVLKTRSSAPGARSPMPSRPSPRHTLLAIAVAAAKKLWTRRVHQPALARQIVSLCRDEEGGWSSKLAVTPPPRLCRLPGDFGFDPLGLGKDPAFLKWYREAELIHGRWAMAAVLGIFMGQPRAE